MRHGFSRFGLLASVVLPAIILTATLNQAAQAADLPGRRSAVAPVFTQVSNGVNWGGFYAGAHLGYGFGEAKNADISGFLGGLHGGGNIQVDRAVFGLEADISYTGIDYRGFSDRFRQKWLMSGRGRLGYSFDQFLPYLTGGVAYTTGQARGPGGSADNSHLGFVLGIGGEYMITQNISARAEYLHYRFGSESYNILPGARKIEITDNVLRIGVSYKF
jgi:outer membrane immunogenic protein